MRSERPPLLLVLGIAAVVVAALAHTGDIRRRAEAALGVGMPRREAELARGFVLGEDDGIDDRTTEDFRRAGLSHLLAVSGQNVALLALLAMPVLALLGMPLRVRLVWVLGLIAVYVPLAGAGPSIQRAGVMGALTLLATLAGRRASRIYGLAVAAVVTLAIDPGVATDVGWQLSFAAVLGILLLAPQLRVLVATLIGARGPVARTLAEGAALTIAATLATAPLIAFHFGELSTVTLLANLLALPAVAPSMWLGMLAAAAGQAPGFPVAVLNAVNAPLLAYIAQVAAWCATPGWACLHVSLGPAGLAASYLGLAAAAIGIPMLARGWRPRPGGRRLAAVGAAILVVVLAWAGLPGDSGESTPLRGLRVSVLDVGQGDAILLQPDRAPAILVDGGPPGDGIAALLRDAGVERLGAAVVTHDQSDHVGGIEELIGEEPIGRLVYAVAGRSLLEEGRVAGIQPERVSAGSELRSGRLRLEVVWPPRELLPGPHTGADPNLLAIVMVARWRGFSMLLTADAEAETTPVDPGPVDVLKVAHHGSDDGGLDELLDRSLPKLAVISVGAGNPYGHPTAATLATLAAHGVRTLRTDRDGTVVLDVRGGSVTVETDG